MSHTNPLSGTSNGRSISSNYGKINNMIYTSFFTCSKCLRSGERPPCMQRIVPSTMAATMVMIFIAIINNNNLPIGRQLKQSVKVFHNLIL